MKDARPAEGAGVPAPRSHGAIGHVPALDGLRGLAVLAVVAFHTHVVLPGGYLGVDLFFVLSGYLITSILLAEHEARGRIDLRAFWVRRARRLLPALLAMMPAVAAYARLVARPDELAGLRADAFATLGYVANWRAIFAGKSYWEIFAAPSPLEHTWSLAIEEQFYVVWPLVVSLVFFARRGRRALLLVTVTLAVASAIAMLVLWSPERASRVYMGSDTRAAAILVGAALACVLRPGVLLGRRSVLALDGLGCIAIGGLAFAWLRLEGESPFLYRGGFWLTEMFALVLIACAVAGPTSLVSRALSFRPIVLVGKISYGVYLWHWPVDVVLSAERVHVGPLALNALRLAVVFTISIASYFVIERPIRAHGIRFARPVVVVPAVFAAASALIAWATLARPAPLPIARTVPAPTIGDRPVPSGEGRAWPGWNSVLSTALPAPGELPPGTLRILFLGDSVGTYLGEACRLRQGEIGSFVAQRGVFKCSLHAAEVRYVGGRRIEEGTSCAATWVQDVAELRPDATVITLGGGYLGPRTCKADWREAYERRLTWLLRAIKNDAGRIIITLVPPPMARWRTKDILERVDCFNGSLEKVARAEGVALIDLKSHTCPTVDCTLLSDGAPVRPDGLHFDGDGARETAVWTLEQIRALARPPRPPPAPP